jgi:hypothetical protein
MPERQSIEYKSSWHNDYLKIAIKQEQCQTCLSIAEREQFIKMDMRLCQCAGRTDLYRQSSTINSTSIPHKQLRQILFRH